MRPIHSETLLHISVSFDFGTENSPKRTALMVGIEVQQHSFRSNRGARHVTRFSSFKGSATNIPKQYE
jgi:hypothetical protein